MTRRNENNGQIDTYKLFLPPKPIANHLIATYIISTFTQLNFWDLWRGNIFFIFYIYNYAFE
jgi:hypothetical protein